MKLCFYLITVSLFIFSQVGSSLASVRIIPRISLSEEYTDNLFLDADNEQDDWITRAEPAISLIYESNLLELDIDYGLSFLYYHNNTDENETALRDVQRASSHALLFPERKFTVLADAEISRVRIDERGPGGEDGDPLNTTNLYLYSVNPQYLWEPSDKFSATLGYRFETRNYESSEGDDSKSHLYSLLLNRRMSSSLEVHLRYTYLDERSDDYSDYEQQNLVAGFVHRFGPRLSLSAEGGFARTDYDDGSDNQGTTWETTLSYIFSELLSMQLSYLDDYSESVDRGQVEEENASLSLLYEGRASIEGRIFWQESKFREDDTTDREYGTVIDLTVPLAGDYYARSFFDYSYLKYLPENEKTDRYGAGVSFGYSFNRLDYSIGYRFRYNDSNFATNDYRNNRVILSLTMRY